MQYISYIILCKIVVGCSTLGPCSLKVEVPNTLPSVVSVYEWLLLVMSSLYCGLCHQCMNVCG